MIHLDVLKTLIEGTGLPEHLIQSELEKLLQQKGISKDGATLEDIREVLVDYLQEVILEAKSTTYFIDRNPS